MNIKDLHKLFIGCDQKVSTDTRSIISGCIFFALKGENFNGNTFAARALESGAAYSVVDQVDVVGSDGRMIWVPDVLTTLQDLAAYHRQTLGVKLVGLTGSNGKTTSKELIHATLSRKFNTLATIGNLNNHIGVPLTLLRLRAEHEVGVIEMGANHQGEIELLARIADPDMGIITNIGKAHIGTMGGMQGIIKTKCELFDHLRVKSGRVFVPSSQAVLIERSGQMPRTTYGEVGSEDIVGCADVDAEGRIRFKWKTSVSEFGPWVETSLVGRYNLDNCLAAVAVGQHFGVSREDIDSAISEYVPSNHRSQQIDVNGVTYIMDAYNANPSSMAEALRSLSGRKGRIGFILGEMLELGDYSGAEHADILNQAMSLRPDLAVFVGDGFREPVSAIAEAHWVADARSAKAILQSTDIQGMTILVKGSRRNRLELVLDERSEHQ